MSYEAFTAEQLRNVIEGKCAYDRIPMIHHFWAATSIFGKDEERAKALCEKYPCDAQYLHITIPDVSQAPEDDPDYKWLYRTPKEQQSAGLDAQILIEDWEELDEIFEHFPDPNYVNMFQDKGMDDSRYRIGCWWYCFFERLWSLRGMENALTDFYLYPDEVHRLFQKLTDFYMRVIERSKEEIHADAVFTSDDIGMQTGAFFSEEIFEEFFKPYYKQLIDKAHSLGMHFWLHTCGNIERFLPHFIEIGLDVIHPIQKYTMEEKKIADTYGDKICIWAGFDVQKTIPFGTPEDVRKEVRFMIDTYARDNGRFMLTCGNGLTPDCKIESFEALLDETYNYGLQKMQRDF